MKIDLLAQSLDDQYKLVVTTIVPRPIALVSTCSAAGVDNAAPISFFNGMGNDPPTIALGLDGAKGGGLKDTTRNVLETREYVVHTVDEDLADAMAVCSINFPSHLSEAEAAGLTLLPCDRIKPKRIEEAPFAFECELITAVQVNDHRHIVIGKALVLHARDGLLNPENFYVDMERYRPVGRLYGRQYVRTRDQFQLPWPDYDDWVRNNKT